METFNLIIGIFVVLSHLWAIALVYSIVFYQRLKDTAWVTWHTRYSLVLLALVNAIGVMGSITYSNIIGFSPCVLCWWQRIFQYPLLIIFTMGVWMKETRRKIIGYSLPLALMGIGTSVYHYLLQRVDSVTNDCAVMGQSVSCEGYYVFELGYITIPLMAMTIFGLTILLLFFVYKRNQ